MRIIAGCGKSKKLFCPSTKKVRPTSDRVKESLFNILGNYIKGALFIDCFAGSGSVGIEALSRGAAYAYFIENNTSCVKAINLNLKRVEVYNQACVIKNDIKKGLLWLTKKGVKADLLFMDPPYGTQLYASTCDLILKTGVLKKDGLLILESHRKDEILDLGWQLVDQRSYGDTKITILK